MYRSDSNTCGAFLFDVLWASPVRTVTNCAASNVSVYIDAGVGRDIDTNNTLVIYKYIYK